MVSAVAQVTDPGKAPRSFGFFPQVGVIQVLGWRPSCSDLIYQGPDLTSIIADGLFLRARQHRSCHRLQKIDRSMSIVGETEEIPNCSNFPLDSRARISDNSAGRFFAIRRRICATRSMRYHDVK